MSVTESEHRPATPEEIWEILRQVARRPAVVRGGRLPEGGRGDDPPRDAEGTAGDSHHREQRQQRERAGLQAPPFLAGRRYLRRSGPSGELVVVVRVRLVAKAGVGACERTPFTNLVTRLRYQGSGAPSPGRYESCPQGALGSCAIPEVSTLR